MPGPVSLKCSVVFLSPLDVLSTKFVTSRWKSPSLSFLAWPFGSESSNIFDSWARIHLELSLALPQQVLDGAEILLVEPDALPELAPMISQYQQMYWEAGQHAQLWVEVYIPGV